MLVEKYEHCPECGSETVREEVDIGVGIMCGPAHCNNCGWTQEAEINAAIWAPGIGDEEEDC